MNPRAGAELKERLRTMYDLDKPLPVQYWLWVKRLAVLDLANPFPRTDVP
jgi:peptide/nickel transport system permease protein